MDARRISLFISILVCGIGVICLLTMKHDGDDASGVGEQSKTVTRTSAEEAPALGGMPARQMRNNAKFAERDARLRFFDVMTPYLSKDEVVAIATACDSGRFRAPNTFTDMTRMAEIVGAIQHNGKLNEFYDALKVASMKYPSDINILRMMVLVSSIHGFREGEYNENLAKLAALDSRSDVAFPYAQQLLAGGDAEAACSCVFKSASDHPEEASGTLSNALRIFVDAKADGQKQLVLGRLKETKLDAFEAGCCGDILYNSGDVENAAYFYKKNTAAETDALNREIARLRLCQIEIKGGSRSEETLATLKELALSTTPMVKAGAGKTLAEIGVDVPTRGKTSNN